MAKTKKMSDKKGRSMKTLFKIARGSDSMLEQALDKLDECVEECVTKKKLIKEKAN